MRKASAALQALRRFSLGFVDDGLHAKEDWPTLATGAELSYEPMSAEPTAPDFAAWVATRGKDHGEGDF